MPDDADGPNELEDLRRRVARLEELIDPEEPDPLVVGTQIFREASKVKAAVVGRK